MRRTIDVEKLLAWAYRDELPKQHLSSAEGVDWGGMQALGTRVDLGASSGSQRYACFGVPHPDALLVEEAVRDLKPRSVDLTTAEHRQWLLEPYAGMLTEREQLAMGEFRVAPWVAQHAVLGTRPAWQIPAPACYPVMSTRGPHAVVSGEYRGRNLYSEGSTCPLMWEPTGYDIAHARAEWLVWRDALDELATRLAMRLKTWVPLPPEVPPDPWRADPPQRRVLPGVVISGPVVLLRPPRPIATRAPHYRLGQAIATRSIDP